MDELQKQVRRAHRRLGFQRFVKVFGWCWFATLLVALGLIVADRFYPLGATVWGWAAEACKVGGSWEARLGVAACGWAAVALAVGLLAAVIWVNATRRNPLGAAIEIDHRFGLKERVSSTLALRPEDRQTEAGRALVEDAVGRVGRVDVATRFAVRPGKQILLPLVPAVLALLVALFGPVMFENPAVANPDAPKVKKQVKKSSETLRRKLADRRKKASDKGLKKAEELFKRLEEGTKELTAGKTERKKALVKLNDLAKELKQRRDSMGGAETIRKQLEQLKNLEQGPADKLTKAIAKGDFKQALQELKKIKEQIAGSKLDDKQKEDLARQLNQMQAKLNKLNDAHGAAQEDLQKRIKQLVQNGQTDQADKLQEQLDKLLQQMPQMQQFEQLADKLGQCAGALRAGQLADAEQALDDFQGGLEDLQQQLDELQMLDEAMDAMAQAKNRMNCPNCAGFG
jgi:hypothetical protein